MKWIGLTGCMGCGKSTVAQLLKIEHGLAVISADEVALYLLNEDLELHDFIFDKMGIQPPTKVDQEGFLKSESDSSSEDHDFLRYRREIADIVFKDPVLLKEYEAFFHPKIKNRVQFLKNDLSLKTDLAFYDVPLLFEKNMQSDFDGIVGVFANPDVQFERIRARNHWSEAEIKDRLKHQASNDQKMKQCDYVITNNLDIEDLKIQVLALVAKLRSH